MSSTPELKITHDGHVTLVEICRPPHNFFDFALIQQIAQTLEDLDQNPQCRTIVLASEGTAFCAGANFNSPDDKISRPENPGTNPLYFEAIRIFACKKPIVAAIHGPAVGGGLGLALVADFRVTCPE
jgi:enoyl-CoA hydratase/carnithine racemase